MGADHITKPKHNKAIPKHPGAGRYAYLFNQFRSFKEDVEALIARLPTPKERGLAFELWCEGYLVEIEGIDPANLWRPEDEMLPPLERQRLGLPREDIGIDSVYFSHTDDAYQFKFRIGRESLCRTDLATFLALAYQCKCHNKIVVTNSERIDPLTHKEVTLIRGSRLDELTPDQLKRIADYVNQEPVAKEDWKEPRQDQYEAICEINQILRTDAQTQCYSFCGTGKTLLQLWLMENRQPETTLVLVPSLLLLSQIRGDWLEEKRTEFLSRAVCSDWQVKRGGEPDISITDLNFPLLTSHQDLTDFLKLETDLPKVIFSTYQSTDFLMQGAKGHEFDLGLFDEAHLTAGRVERAFSRALHNKNVRIKKRVFFTATPSHSDPSRRDAEGDPIKLYEMDDEGTYGKVAYDLSCRRAIELDIICDYKVLATTFTTTQVNDWLRRHGETLVESETEGPDWVKACQVANQLALAKAHEDHPDITHIFTFHSSVGAANDFVARGTQGVGSHLKDFYCETINSVYMDMGERKDKLRIFRASSKALLSNFGCLIHGVNEPCLNLVMFGSPKKNRISCAQAASRCLRKADDKEVGYILVPLYVALAEGESFDEAARRANFDTVVEVLQTLKERDEKFADILRELAQPRARAKGYADWRLREHVDFICPEVLYQHLVDSIRIQVIDQLIPSWEKRYADLVAFKQAHGRWPRAGSDSEEGRLGEWCIYLRRRRKENALSEDRIAST